VHAEPAAQALGTAGVEVLLRHRVQRVDVDGTAVAGLTVDGGQLAAEAVVLAVPHEEAAALLPAAAGVDGAGLRRLGSSPIVNIHVVYNRPVTGFPFAAGVGTPVQFVFDRTGASGIAASDGRQYLSISLSGADDYVSTSTEDLRSVFAAELARMFPAAGTARIERFFVTREPTATFRAAPGTERLRPGTRT